MPHSEIPQFGLDYFAYRDESDLLDSIVELLDTHGLYSENLVFSGFNGCEVATGNYPERDYLFAENVGSWREQIAFFSGRNAGPFFYALFHDSKPGSIPAIGAYDPSMLHSGKSRKVDYLSLPGKFISDACVAIIYLGNTIWDKDFRQTPLK